MFTSDYFLDVMWLKSLSPYLDRFKATSASERTFNCRCPVCGDSKKSKRLARCYFYTSHGSLNVSCKNCGYGRSFYNFVRDVFPDRFDEYKMEQLKARLGQSSLTPYQSDTKTQQQPPQPQQDHSSSLDGVVSIDKLGDDHPAKMYLKSRGIPVDCFARLFYSSNFKTTASSISYRELSPNFPDEGRIVIPFYDKSGNITMIQGRSLLPNSSLRYITIKASEDANKVFGMDAIDPDKPVYACEGPFDSLFVDNCIASCDSFLTRLDADVYIWDNEPRNPEIVELMHNAIEKGKSLVIWPFSPERKVDMNDMVKTGIYSSTDELMQTIQNNTFSGIQAELKFQQWKRC